MITVLDDTQLAAVCGGYSPELFAQMQTSISMGLTVNSTWTGEHGTSSAGWSHYNGRAFDSIGSQDQMWKFYNESLGTKPHELIFHQKHIEDGKSLPPMGGHDTHIHYGK
jgi:hypothetical protein